jgi:thiosulfate reductase cytochrome b subunit
VFTGAYVAFSFLLLFALGLTLLVHGASGAVLIAFLIVWVVPTYLVARLWRRAMPRRSRP